MVVGKNGKSSLTAVLLFVITVVTFFIGGIPYLIAESDISNRDKFLGQVAYTNDQNMYFSFIRQAYTGKWIFNNRLTHLENRDCFINLQFAGVGKLWKLFKLSENSTYQLWRYLGIVFLVFGYFLLTRYFFKEYKQRFWATIFFTFAGGFGLLFALLNMVGLLSKELFYTFTFDLWAGVFPFQQMLTNPHFSLPHGLLLIGIAFYLHAYTKNNQIKYYILSGLVFAVDGLIRPYDLISIFAIIPLFVLVESIIRFNYIAAFRQLIPLGIAIPSLLYSIWLFKFDPVFKYWSLQGYNIDLIPLPHLHLFAYGIFTIFFILRLCAIKSNPLSGSERFIAIGFLSIFFLTHIGHIIPSLGFSPQIGVPLFAFISILSFVYVFTCVKKYKKIVFAVILIAVACGAGGITLYFTQKFTKTHNSNFYLTNSDVLGFDWLKSHVAKTDVILSTPEIASRIAKYTDAQVVAGHYSVTPEFKKQEENLRILFSQNSVSIKMVDSLFTNRVNYVYVNKNDTAYVRDKEITFDGLNKVYENDVVEIYKRYY
jgi:hypothetical protein